MITSEKIEMLSYVENAILEYFSISSIDVLKSRARDENTNNARFYLWHILHYDFGFSITELSELYCRSRRNISARISKIKYRIENICYYNDEYKNISEKIAKFTK